MDPGSGPDNNFKYFCKICKKGFVCGRALGGHMRAHGIEGGADVDDEDGAASDWEAPLADENKRMYALRTNPNRRSCRFGCEKCGGEEEVEAEAESLVSLPSGSDDDVAVGEKRWSKRKRTARAAVGSEEEDLANCLMMLSNATVDTTIGVDQPEESTYHVRFAAARAPPLTLGGVDKAKGVASSSNNNNNNKGLFECKACKKVFNSHQALGGHRASHKKVKGCFAARLDGGYNQDGVENDEFLLPPRSTLVQFDQRLGSRKKSKVHECSICHRVFSSGQALGGHKRCHWITTGGADTATLAQLQQLHEQDYNVGSAQEAKILSQTEQALDLNLPASGDDPHGLKRDSKSVLSLKVSTEFFLKPWGGISVTEKREDNHHHHHNHEGQHNDEESQKDLNKTSQNNNSDGMNIDDEADSKAKLAKLSELKDMNSGSGLSPWLQVGIGSSDGVGENP